MIFLYILASVAALFLMCCLIEIHRYKITDYTIEDSKIPNTLKGKKIVLLSDLHSVRFGPDNSKLFRAVREQNPDYIVIAGDLITGSSFEKELHYAEHFLGEAAAVGCPVYYTFGNHELKSESPEEYEALCRKKVTVLNNASVYGSDMCKDFSFTGISLPFETYHDKTFTSLKVSDYVDMSAIDNSTYRILTAHDPRYIKDYLNGGFSLVLSGHLHGGIIRIPLLGGLITPRFELFTKITRGCYRFDNGTLILSAGLGWHGLPIRFNNVPEIVVLHF